MHELGVVFHIADSVVKIAQDNQAQHVRRVTLHWRGLHGDPGLPY